MGIGNVFFGGVPLFFSLFFLFTFGLVVFGIVSSIASAARNAKAPIITVEAKVIGKRTDVSTHINNTADNTHITHTSDTYYYITFETEHGERIEFSISGRMYGLLVEGDKGQLTYQGEWFKDFRRM